MTNFPSWRLAVAGWKQQADPDVWLCGEYPGPPDNRPMVSRQPDGSFGWWAEAMPPWWAEWCDRGTESGPYAWLRACVKAQQ